MKEEKVEVDVKFEDLLNQINSVKANYEVVTKEVLKTVERPNGVLQNQIGKFYAMADEKENEIQYIVVFWLEFIQIGWKESCGIDDEYKRSHSIEK